MPKVRVQRRERETTCPLCLEQLTEDAFECECGVRYHAACVNELGGKCVPGCDRWLGDGPARVQERKSPPPAHVGWDRPKPRLTQRAAIMREPFLQRHALVFHAALFAALGGLLAHLLRKLGAGGLEAFSGPVAVGGGIATGAVYGVLLGALIRRLGVGAVYTGRVGPKGGPGNAFFGIAILLAICCSLVVPFLTNLPILVGIGSGALVFGLGWAFTLRVYGPPRL